MQEGYLECKFCHDPYDLEDKIPRMLISCGHSICDHCLKSFVYKNLKLACVECNSEETIYMPSTDYQDKFPVNQALVSMIETQRDSNNSSQISDEKSYSYSEHSQVQIQSEESVEKDSLELQLNQLNKNSSVSIDRCLQHNKKNTVICFTCQERICYKCGLFGEHKGHSHQQENEFYNEVELFKGKVEKKLKKINDTENLLKVDFMSKYYNSQAKSKQNELKKDVDSFYEEIILKMKKKKKEFLKLIEKRFQEKEAMYQTRLINITEESEIETNLVKKSGKNLMVILEKNSEKELIGLMSDQSVDKMAKKILINYQNKIQTVQKSIHEFLQSIELIYNEAINLDLISLKMDNKDLNEENEFDDLEDDSKEDLMNSNYSDLSNEKIVNLIDSPCQQQEPFMNIYQNDFQQEQISSYQEILNNSNNSFAKIRTTSMVGLDMQNSMQKKRNTFNQPLYYQEKINRQQTMRPITSYKNLAPLPQQYSGHNSPKSRVQKSGQKQMTWLTLLKEQKNKKQNQINLDNLKLSDKDIDVMLNILDNGLIKSLSLKNNRISDNGVEKLCLRLQSINIKAIDLSNNKLSFQSIAYLLELAQKNKNLSKIIFKDIPVKLNLKKTYSSSFKKLNVDFVVQFYQIYYPFNIPPNMN